LISKDIMIDVQIGRQSFAVGTASSRQPCGLVALILAAEP